MRGSRMVFRSVFVLPPVVSLSPAGYVGLIICVDDDADPPNGGGCAICHGTVAEGIALADCSSLENAPGGSGRRMVSRAAGVVPLGCCFDANVARCGGGSFAEERSRAILTDCSLREGYAGRMRLFNSTNGMIPTKCCTCVRNSAHKEGNGFSGASGAQSVGCMFPEDSASGGTRRGPTSGPVSRHCFAVAQGQPDGHSLEVLLCCSAGSDGGQQRAGSLSSRVSVSWPWVQRDGRLLGLLFEVFPGARPRPADDAYACSRLQRWR